jgi:undecaprenyl pyrophosphate phosphatase UppP
VRRFWLAIGVAFLPAALLDMLLHTWIKSTLFGSAAVVGWTLIVVVSRSCSSSARQ